MFPGFVVLLSPVALFLVPLLVGSLVLYAIYKLATGTAEAT